MKSIKITILAILLAPASIHCEEVVPLDGEPAPLGEEVASSSEGDASPSGKVVSSSEGDALFSGEGGSLSGNSPFGESVLAEAEEAEAEVEAEIYELRGVFAGPNGKLFSIYTASDQKSRWVRQGDTSSGISIDSYDERAKILYFTAPDGTKKSIPLKSSSNGI